ncbi:MAG: hypothetical protein OSB21_00015 [Myxococcota bacterium]|nr:hypothetical protein [Myxococcota bacterium]
MIDALIPSGICLHCDEARADSNPWICGGCAVSIRRDEPPNDLLSLYLYEGAVSSLLRRAKHPLEPAIYAELLKADFTLPENASYVPVPTPWLRRFKRRGCQTTCIAQLLVKRFGGKVVHALKRRRNDKAQASMNAEDRRSLADDTFVCRQALPPGPVVLIDDIYTTGSTLRAASNALLEGQPNTVQLLRFTLARVP